MAVESSSDRAYFFSATDFGTAADFTDPDLGTVNGIYDNQTIEISLDGGVNVESDQPMFKCRTSDIPGVGEGSAVTIDSTSYVVKDRQDDGTGTTQLTLQNA